ncbi:MAG TPA: hypothetical protein VD866_22300 [Urbifossiella sp.]|nr:hypothetical protein [Urbifossiella sp.]
MNRLLNSYRDPVVGGLVAAAGDLDLLGGRWSYPAAGDTDGGRNGLVSAVTCHANRVELCWADGGLLAMLRAVIATIPVAVRVMGTADPSGRSRVVLWPARPEQLEVVHAAVVLVEHRTGTGSERVTGDRVCLDMEVRNNQLRPIGTVFPCLAHRQSDMVGTLDIVLRVLQSAGVWLTHFLVQQPVSPSATHLDLQLSGVLVAGADPESLARRLLGELPLGNRCAAH